jgi:site-specific DNA-methyltransferase (adenine-specific)
VRKGSKYVIRNENCLAVMADMSDESVDIVVTDPPYVVCSGGNNNNFGGQLFKVNDGQLFTHIDIKARDYLPELYRVMKPQSDLYLMTSYLHLADFQAAAIEAGFRLHNILVWHKVSSTANRWYMKNIEFTLYLYKGSAKTINNPSSAAMLTIPNPRNKTHPCEKPVQLMRHYIENSSRPGDTVFDPFMGSGSTGVAAIQSGREFIGAEIDAMYFKRASVRIKDAETERTWCNAPLEGLCAA